MLHQQLIRHYNDRLREHGLLGPDAVQRSIEAAGTLAGYRLIFGLNLPGAHVFQISEEVISCARSVRPDSLVGTDLLPLTRRMPFDHLFLELPMQVYFGSDFRGDLGLFVFPTDDGVNFTLMTEHCGKGYEPLCIGTLDHAGQIGRRRSDVVVHQIAWESGLGPDAMERHVDDYRKMSEWAFTDALYIFQLMAAKNSPLATGTANAMSRQERRAMERAGRLAKGEPPKVTRIDLNARGREHMASLSQEAKDELGEIIRRRAHWVRGHILNTPTKGPVWRSAHVRGFGEINETVRVVTADPSLAEMDLPGGPS